MTAKVIPGKTDVLESIRYQQDMILEDFEAFKAAAGAARVQPFASLKARTRQIIAAEEEEFYPIVAELGTEQSDLVDTATDENGDIETALAAVELAGAGSASGGQVTTLETALKSHITAERGELFASARIGLTASQKRQLAATLSGTAADDDLS